MSDEYVFGEIDASEVAEENMQRLLGVELLEARKLVRIYRTAIKKLNMDIRSKRYFGYFDESRMSFLKLKLNKQLDFIERESKKELIYAFKLLGKQAAFDLTDEFTTLEKNFEGVSTQPIPIDAIRMSLRRDVYLVNRADASLKTYNAHIRAGIERALSESVVKRDSYSKATKNLAGALVEVTNQEWKIARIARTELHQLYNSSKILSMQRMKEKFVPDLQKGVFTPEDARTEEDSNYFASLNQIVNLDKHFTYSWKGKTRTFLSPPDRPNDRSILIPIRKSWRTKNATANTHT